MEYIRTYDRVYHCINIYKHNKKYYCEVIAGCSSGCVEYYNVVEMKEDNCVISVTDNISKEVINLIKRVLPIKV